MNAPTGACRGGQGASAAAGSAASDVDPISALEALASETRRVEPKKAPAKDAKKS